MGALHAGHLSLVDLARQHANDVVLTVFVNPLQFGPSEDLARYPRPFERDCALAAEAGVTAVFAPERTAMYPPGFQTHVEVEQLTLGLCGGSRPGHFRGVTTVVCKLLNLALAEVAVFGEKDWQQLAAIRRMARDLDHPTRILGGPIVREADGLAMSSRNVYLNPEARAQAVGISRALRQAQAEVRAGARDVALVRGAIVAAIEAAGGRVDYVELVDPELLAPVADLAQPTRAIVAAWFGGARLLDNVALAPSLDGVAHDGHRPAPPLLR
jgi:pantoate--beta-alanine ligase